MKTAAIVAEDISAFASSESSSSDEETGYGLRSPGGANYSFASTEHDLLNDDKEIQIDDEDYEIYTADNK